MIYLTDANWVFGTTVQSHDLLSFAGTVPDAIIVGIVSAGVERAAPTDGNVAGAERAFDLTPTQDLEQQRRFEREYKRQVRTGGAQAFLRWVRRRPARPSDGVAARESRAQRTRSADRINSRRASTDPSSASRDEGFSQRTRWRAVSP